MEYWLNIKKKVIIYFVFLPIDNNKDTYNPYLLNLDVHVQVCKASSGKNINIMAWGVNINNGNIEGDSG